MFTQVLSTYDRQSSTSIFNPQNNLNYSLSKVIYYILLKVSLDNSREIWKQKNVWQWLLSHNECNYIYFSVSILTDNFVFNCNMCHIFKIV